jgi:tetratricopeptide (TPR) repeat protein/mono/diheme cytochrome c family protein
VQVFLRPLWILAMLAVASNLSAQPSPAAPVTFTKDVAPIVFQHCASCHHPGGAAPFSVLSYSSARLHARQIADVTKRGYMPPWKPAPGSGPFVGENRLTTAQIDLLQRWAESGAPEGASQLPPVPKISTGWQLGTPDLIVNLPAYEVDASGTDVFRIFVVALPTTVTRFVRGLEFRPGNANVVHHANIRVDRTPTSRRLDDEDPAPGYDGLLAHTATYPDGQFLAWTPGQAAPLLPKGLSWRLEPGTDLVVELHLQPTGKHETIEPTIGLFFTNDPPERTPGMLRLGRQNIDIPAGRSDYTITDSFVLPVDVEVLALQPHAHYRARHVLGMATLPDGSRKSLIDIPDWDFRWQQVYRFVDPVKLPKGTTIAMQYLYDNSADNPRNVTRPPQHVVWGQRSADEMGDLWFQVLTATDRDLDVLMAAFRPKVIAEDIIGYEGRIRAEPESAALHDDVALLYLDEGRFANAVNHFRQSLAMKPASAAAHYNLATALTLAGSVDEAVLSYEKALELRPDYALAHNNLGAILFQRGQLDAAGVHLREAVRLDPKNADALDNLGRLNQRLGDARSARQHFEQALVARPDWTLALVDLAWMLAASPEAGATDPQRAVELAQRAVNLSARRDIVALDALAAALAAAGDFDRAIAVIDEALKIVPNRQAADVLRQRQTRYRQHTPPTLP